MRTYELTFVLDPRLTDEQTRVLCDEYRQMIETAGGRIEHQEDWGKRSLAYPIGKLQEGRYFLYHLSCEEGNPTLEAERRMRQKEDVLRYLTVRTEQLDFKEEDREAAAAPAAADTTSPAEPAAPAEPAVAVAESAAVSEAIEPEPAPAPAPEPEEESEPTNEEEKA